MSTYTEDNRKVTTSRLIEMKQRGEKISSLLHMIIQWLPLSIRPEWMLSSLEIPHRM